MDLAQRIEEHASAIGLRAKTRDEVLSWVARRFEEAGVVSSAEDALAQLVERERIMSTAIMPGLAIPHARCPGASRTAFSLVSLERGVDFGGEQDTPVSLVFTIVGAPEATSEHVQLLAAIARRMGRQGAFSQLLAAQDFADVQRALSEG